MLLLGSIEYFLATALQACPFWMAALAALASARVLVRMMSMLRVSGVPNCDLWVL